MNYMLYYILYIYIVYACMHVCMLACMDGLIVFGFETCSSSRPSGGSVQDLAIFALAAMARGDQQEMGPKCFKRI